MAADPHIGTLNEAHLHASLKELVSEPGDRFEVRVDRFVVDILRGDLIVEIQTRSFGSMKAKLHALLATRKIKLIHPIAHERWIVKLARNKKETDTRRKSPKRQGLEAIFSELVSVPDLIDHPNLEIELILVQEDEIRYHDPKKAWRRKGWVVQERRLLDVLDRMIIRSSADLFSLIGSDLPVEFTTADIAKVSGWNRRTAQQAAYCLRGSGAIEMTGKQGNAIIYRKTADSPQNSSSKRKKKGTTRSETGKTRKKKQATSKKTVTRKTKTTPRKVSSRTASKKRATRKKSPATKSS